MSNKQLLTKKELGNIVYESLTDKLQLALDACGLGGEWVGGAIGAMFGGVGVAPGAVIGATAGGICDIASGLIDLVNGRILMALLSFLAAIPVVGAAFGGGKAFIKAAKYVYGPLKAIVGSKRATKTYKASKTAGGKLAARAKSAIRGEKRDRLVVAAYNSLMSGEAKTEEEAMAYAEQAVKVQDILKDNRKMIDDMFVRLRKYDALDESSALGDKIDQAEEMLDGFILNLDELTELPEGADLELDGDVAIERWQRLAGVV
jgi:hypothetical protein